MVHRYFAFTLATVALGGCGVGASTGSSPLVSSTSVGEIRPAAAAPASPIKHVVIISQENRSFDNIFYGFPGADTATMGLKSDGTMTPLAPVQFEDLYDPGHSFGAWQTEYDNGKMDGFDKNSPNANPTYDYAYVPRQEVQPYFDLATQYALADRMFQSDHASSFPSHQYEIAGQSPYAFGSPSNSTLWGCDAPAGTTVNGIDANGKATPNVFPCFDYLTIGDVLERASHTYKVYTPAVGTIDGLLNGFDAIRHVRYGSDWPHIYQTPETNILADAASAPLADVTFVYPQDAVSDHALGGTSGGPQWVANVVNAIGASANWNSTAIFITWDDWGGWYDHVKPTQLDAYGLSFRVPLIVVSPYAKHGYVSHVQHEFGSLLKFVETNFGTASLNATDVRSDDLRDMFDFTQPPSSFKTIATRLKASYFIAHAHDRNVPDY